MQLVLPTFWPVWSTVTLFNQSAMGYYINPPPLKSMEFFGGKKDKIKGILCG